MAARLKGFKAYYVHRFVWENYNGAISDGLVIDRKNDNKIAKRLENLQLLTSSEISKKYEKKNTKRLVREKSNQSINLQRKYLF